MCSVAPSMACIASRSNAVDDCPAPVSADCCGSGAASVLNSHGHEWSYWVHSVPRVHTAAAAVAPRCCAGALASACSSLARKEPLQATLLLAGPGDFVACGAGRLRLAAASPDDFVACGAGLAGFSFFHGACLGGASSLAPMLGGLIAMVPGSFAANAAESLEALTPCGRVLMIFNGCGEGAPSGRGRLCTDAGRSCSDAGRCMTLNVQRSGLSTNTINVEEMGLSESKLPT